MCAVYTFSNSLLAYNMRIYRYAYIYQIINVVVFLHTTIYATICIIVCRIYNNLGT